MSQPDFLYELFEDFIDDPANQDFSMDNGLACRWLTAQAKISPKISAYYSKPSNQKKLAEQQKPERGISELQKLSASSRNTIPMTVWIMPKFRIILNAYPVIWLLPESNIRTTQLPSSVGQDRIILLPDNEITKVRNTKHYDKIYRKTNSYNPKQRASV